jgi:hypothetical protein
MLFSTTAQKILTWWSLLALVAFGLSWMFLLEMVPPPPATLNAAQIAAIYLARAAHILDGAAITSWTGGFLIPLSCVLTAQMVRLQKAWSIWSMMQLVGGVMTSLWLSLPTIFWGAAAFQPDRAIDATMLANQLGALTMVTTDQYYMYWLVPIAVICLTVPYQDDSPFPRWLGYLTIFETLALSPGPFAFLFKSGLFAWNGLLVLFIPLFSFFIWMAFVFWQLLRALGRQNDAGTLV